MELTSPRYPVFLLSTFFSDACSEAITDCILQASPITRQNILEGENYYIKKVVWDQLQVALLQPKWTTDTYK
jgi:hypothetical protein